MSSYTGGVAGTAPQWGHWRMWVVRGPLAGRYPAAAAMVILFLVPYLGLSSAVTPIQPLITGQLHMSAQAFALATGMANAAYAVGTVLAVQFAQLLPQRRMLLVYGPLLVIGAVLTAAAPNAGVFIAGHILAGLCTSLLLIAAAPPLIIGYPLSKLRWSAVILNLGVFGAVAAGPLIGGAQASFHAWRPLFWIAAGIAAAALLLSLLTFEDTPPGNLSAPRDVAAIALAGGGCAAAFFGVSELVTHTLTDPVVLGTVEGGLALIVILWVYQYFGKRVLLPLNTLSTTFPVAGIVAAVGAAAASGSAIALGQGLLIGRYPPLHLGLLFIPEVGAAVLSAILFGLVFQTRLIHWYALGGILVLAAGVLVIRAVIPPTQNLALIGSGLIGIGVGASVVPALFIAGFSLRSAAVQRVFAIVELMRGIAAFMVAPMLVYVAAIAIGGTAGARTALWVCFWLAIGSAVIGILLYAAGGIRPPSPDMNRWFSGQPAWDSPPLLGAARGRPAVPGPELAGAPAAVAVGAPAASAGGAPDAAAVGAPDAAAGGGPNGGGRHERQEVTPDRGGTVDTLPEGAMPPVGPATAAGPGNGGWRGNGGGRPGDGGGQPGDGGGQPEDAGGPLVTGRISQPDGAPVSGAAVTLMDTSGHQTGRTSTDPDGLFRIPAPRAGLYTLITMAAAHQPQVSRVRVGSAADGPVHNDVILAGTSQLTGTVRAGGTGEPVARATVTLAGPSGQVLAMRTTDATGRYGFTELVSGDYSIAVSAPGREPAGLPVTVAAGGGETVQDVELAGRSRLTGTARSADGRAIADARVALLDPDGNVAAVATTGPDGSYSIEDLPPGEYTLATSGYPPVAQSVRIEPGQRHTHDPVLGYPGPPPGSLGTGDDLGPEGG